jgi:hypothetical protein
MECCCSRTKMHTRIVFLLSAVCIAVNSADAKSAWILWKRTATMQTLGTGVDWTLSSAQGDMKDCQRKLKQAVSKFASPLGHDAEGWEKPKGDDSEELFPWHLRKGAGEVKRVWADGNEGVVYLPGPSGRREAIMVQFLCLPETVDPRSPKR